MLSQFLRISFFLMVILLLASCAAQKSITSSNVTTLNSELHSGQPAQKITIAEKPAVVPRSESDEVEKEGKPVKETGSTTEQASVSIAEPVPEKVSIALNVEFDTGKANIKPIFHNDIRKIADFMNKYSSMSAIIEGHTDNVGKESVNVELSLRRATKIKAYLVNKFGIDSSRIRVVGYDYQKPIASNETVEGRQKNRRGETHIVADGIPNKVYSFFEDSDLPKGGFPIVNQEYIDEKIQSFKELQGDASYSSKAVKGTALEIYAMWGGIFSHCAIRIETNPDSFYQLELQSLSDLKKAGMIDFRKIGAAIRLFGATENQFDVVEFTDKDERTKLDNLEPHYATMPICIGKRATRKTTQWYKDCLRQYARSYNPENGRKVGNQPKVFDYSPTIHNCCNFAEEALEACGLANCFDLGKSTGLHHKTGSLEE